VKAALHTYAIRAGQPESARMRLDTALPEGYIQKGQELDGGWTVVSALTRDPDDGEAFFADIR